MRVTHYEAIVISGRTKTTAIRPFTENQANECGGVLNKDGLTLALAHKLCEKWTRQGTSAHYRSAGVTYEYNVLVD
jgi:hypothetical protein